MIKSLDGDVSMNASSCTALREAMIVATSDSYATLFA
jgi:hypothetical protein